MSKIVSSLFVDTGWEYTSIKIINVQLFETKRITKHPYSEQTKTKWPFEKY